MRPAIALVAFLALWIGAAWAEAEPPRYVYWSAIPTPGRVNYELAVVRAALEKSRDVYGDYQLVLDNTYLPSVRGRQALVVGDRFDFVATTVWDYEARIDGLAVIPYPIAYGILGYRRLLVRAGDVANFGGADIQYLRRHLAGQGRGWPDVGVYQANNLPVDEVDTFESLWPMLVSGRVDYVPLGVDEAEPTLAAYRSRFPQLAKVPDLLLHYSMPLYLVVCACRPDLVERLTNGMRRLSESGELWALFRAHKGEALRQLSAGQPRVIELDNPHVPDVYRPQGPALLENHRH